MYVFIYVPLKAASAHFYENVNVCLYYTHTLHTIFTYTHIYINTRAHMYTVFMYFSVHLKHVDINVAGTLHFTNNNSNVMPSRMSPWQEMADVEEVT